MFQFFYYQLWLSLYRVYGTGGNDHIRSEINMTGNFSLYVWCNIHARRFIPYISWFVCTFHVCDQIKAGLPETDFNAAVALCTYVHTTGTTQHSGCW